MLPTVYAFDGYRLDPARRSLTDGNGASVKLTGKAFDVLVYLVEHGGYVVERAALVHAVWPKRVVEDNNLNQAIATLRRVLGEHHVATVAGRGYQFVTPVRRLDVAPSSEIEPSASVGESTAAAPPRRSLWRAALGATLAAGLLAAVVLGLPPQRSAPGSLIGASVTVQLLTAYPGEELTPALSPDGTRVAFSWSGPSARRGIYLAQVGIAEPVPLTDPGEAEDLYPAWSPDGERIAFVRRHDPEAFDIMVTPVLGGGAARVYTGKTRWISVEGSPVVAWAPGGRLLFAAQKHGASDDGRYGLHRLDLATGIAETIALEDEESHFTTSPAVSSDGQWLAFARYTLSQRLNQIMVQRLGPDLVPVGSPEPVEGLDPDIYHSLHWSPSGDRLWFANSHSIFEWPLGGSPEAVHTLGAPFTSGSMSIVPRANGARVAVVVRHSDDDLFALRVDPVTHAAIGAAQVRAKSSGLDLHPRVSPDNKTLAFVSDRSGSREIWLADLDGSNARKLTSLGQLVVGYPRWSPDGKFIVFHSSAPNEPRVIYRVDVESGVTLRLFNGCCPGGWSLDGRSLYVTEIADINYVARVDVATGRRERLIEGETAIESEDGEFLLYAKTREPGYFRWPLNAASGTAEAVRLVGDYRPSRGGLAPVADGFYYIGLTADFVDARALRFYDYSLGEARDVAPVPTRTSIGLTVTSDGREVLYAGIDGAPEADILLVELQAKRAR